MSPKSNPPPAAAGEKLDLFRLFKADYVAKSTPVLLTPAPAHYLVVSGKGAPGEPLFEVRITALYAVAFTIKMTRKFEGLGDYAVGRMEGRYPDLPVDGGPVPPMDQWSWEMMIRTPEFVGEEDLASALAALRKRGKEGDGALVRLATIEEGECVQMLHVGPYEDEHRSFARMRAFAASKGRAFAGPAHEVYLSDPRRVAPDRLKTILRMPVRPA